MGNNGDMSGSTQGSTGPQQQGVQASGPEQALRMHQAEALLRSQAEAALRLAVKKKFCFSTIHKVRKDTRFNTFVIIIISIRSVYVINIQKFKE